MSGMNSDQLYRSTLGIYSSLMDEFNPSLQKLVLLGNSYVQAFRGFTHLLKRHQNASVHATNAVLNLLKQHQIYLGSLAATSEAYFSALSKIGEKAFHTMSSRSLGDVLIQISESQRRLTLELEGLFRWFSMEVLQEMDNNIRLDKDFISGSRSHYEMEVQRQAAALQRQLMRGSNQDCSEYVQFLKVSHREALGEEERRYRFLAEKHCGLIQSFAHLMNKVGGSLQQTADTWTEKANATRQPEARQPTILDNAGGIKEEEMRKNKEELALGKIPSRAPSPQGSISCFAADPAAGGPGGRSMRALVAHQPSGSRPTLLPFTRGEVITVLVQQPKNGWLYGRADSSLRQGWFPASYVEPLDDTATRSSTSTLRSSNSMSNLLNQSGSSSHIAAPPPPPPPPSSSIISNKRSEVEPVTSNPDKRAESNSENKRPQPHGSRPELFPRGTNPFATVKLKPTSTNDRSAPRLYRR